MPKAKDYKDPLKSLIIGAKGKNNKIQKGIGSYISVGRKSPELTEQPQPSGRLRSPPQHVKRTEFLSEDVEI